MQQCDSEVIAAGRAMDRVSLLFMRNLREQLAKILVERSYLESEEGFVLASGKRSRFYFDCRATTLYAEATRLIGSLVLDEIRRAGTEPDGIGGLTMGADPIAVAVARASLDGVGTPINAFVVRKERKTHGTGNSIEGGLPQGSRVVIVDDVATSGGSVIDAIDRAEEEGMQVVQAIVLVDREESGMARIQERLPDRPVSAVFTKSELDALRG